MGGLDQIQKILCNIPSPALAVRPLFPLMASTLYLPHLPFPPSSHPITPPHQTKRFSRRTRSTPRFRRQKTSKSLTDEGRPRQMDRFAVTEEERRERECGGRQSGMAFRSLLVTHLFFLLPHPPTPSSFMSSVGCLVDAHFAEAKRDISIRKSFCLENVP